MKPTQHRPMPKDRIRLIAEELEEMASMCAADDDNDFFTLHRLSEEVRDLIPVREALVEALESALSLALDPDLVQSDPDEVTAQIRQALTLAKGGE